MQPEAGPQVPTAAPAEQQETLSSETMKLLGRLKPDPTLPTGDTLPALKPSLQSAAQAGVRIEVLKHPLGVVGLEWSPNDSMAGDCLPACSSRMALQACLPDCWTLVCDI